jgi:iron complex outermembrane receptor protein
MSEVTKGHNWPMSKARRTTFSVYTTTATFGITAWARLAVFAAFTLLPLPAQDPNPQDLTQSSIEDLMKIQVTSVSKKDQQLFKAGAAVFVITQEDIRRSGATNIPDLLRMAPGVNVARVDSNTWAISIRGFNGIYADKVLVLVDGRSIYSPAFSGVYWDQVNVPLEDIERIEVIRGPGGTVWGANAMNGVINVITLSSKSTHGGLVSTAAGHQSEIDGLAQYGGEIGNSASYRAFGRYFSTDTSSFPNGSDAADGFRGVHGGFRADWDMSASDNLTVEGNGAQLNEGQTVNEVLSQHLPTSAIFNDQMSVSSGDILGRWDHTLQNGSDVWVQSYFSHYDHVGDGITDILSVFNLELQHHIALGPRHDVVWGVGYRRTDNSLSAGYDLTFSPARRNDNLYSAFIQDQVSLTSSLALTVGTKIEHNAFSGWEMAPGAQLVWTPSANHALWASASQAVRQPADVDSSLVYDAAVIPFPNGSFGVVREFGTPNIKSELLHDYEAGYRAQLGKRFSVDVAAFRGYYRNLETVAPGAPFLAETGAGVPYEVIPYYAGNLGRVHSYGGEVFGNWKISNRWRISPGYSLLHMRVISDPAVAVIERGNPADNPQHQFELRSFMNLRRNLEWDVSVFYVGRLADGPVPAYTRVDTHLGWRVGEHAEFSIVGQNLVSPRHLECAGAFEVVPTEAERSILGRITWRF